MLKISVSPELSMNSSSPALTPFRTLMSNWSTRCSSERKGPAEHAPQGPADDGGGQSPAGRFIWHDVGVLET